MISTTIKQTNHIKYYPDTWNNLKTDSDIAQIGLHLWVLISAISILWFIYTYRAILAVLQKGEEVKQTSKILSCLYK